MPFEPTPGRRRAEEDGAALVEFALVLIPLLLLTIGTLGFALTLGLQQSVTHAASAAARESAVVVADSSTGREAAIQGRSEEVVAEQLSWLGAAVPAVTTEFPDGRVRVTVATDNPFRGIGLTLGPLDVRPPARLSSSATIDLEDL